MKLLLVRHGETDWNSVKKVQGGGSDIPLNDVGREQAKKAGEKLKGEVIDVSYASPQDRAHETARHINDHHEHDIILSDLLVERNYGDLEGTYYPELDGAMTKIYHEDSFDEYNIERIEAFEERLSQFWEELYQKHKGQTVLVVSHSSVSKMLVAIALGITIHESRKRIGHKKNASITTIHFDENDEIIDLRIAESDHLD